MRMTMGSTLVSVAVAAVGVLTLTPLAARVLKQKGVLDVPNARSSHSRPTPRGAGLATGVVLTVALALGRDGATFSIAAVALLATVLGGFEDLHGAGVAVRLAAQIAIATAFLAVTSATGTPLPWAGAVGALIFIVGYTNAFNFMDGVNGISSVSAATAGLTFVALAALTNVPDLQLAGAVIAASAACFLPFNFPHARVFLGDSGSYSFGAAIACTAVIGWHSGIRADAVLAPLAMYLVDSGSVIILRLVRRQHLATPHRQHAYQRLVRLGASHVQVATVVFVGSAATGALGLAVVRAEVPERVALDLGIAAIASFYLMLPVLITARQRAHTLESL
jgi:UDP-GlcNAc:undecaprenyl-phosphate GlcNAc-1-phosphate transferase